MNLKLFLVAFLIFFCELSTISAQNTLERFGKNRIQYKKFEWKYISTPNFEIYFYDSGVRLSQFAARLLENDFVEITDMLGFQPTKRTRIFLYNSIADLQQSNMGVHDDGLVVGGLTDFFKAQVEVAFVGSETEFKKELRRRLAFMLVREMMFGANLKDMIQSSYLGKYNEWFLFGIADYVAEGWSAEMDDYIRDMVRKKRWRKPHLATGKEAIILGHSIWNFIAEKHGKNNISSILNAARITRNERTGIGYALGVDYLDFIDDWENFYTAPAKETLKNLVDAPSTMKLAGKNRRGKVYNQLLLNPEGTKVAYSESKNGKYKVFVQKVGSKKRKVIFKGGYDAVNQRVDEDIPLISWRNNTDLGIIYQKKSKLTLSVYNTNPKNYIIFNKYKRNYKRQFENFSHIRGFDFSDDGENIVFSADKTDDLESRMGQNDLFIFQIKENNLKPITNDYFDDLHPVFLPNSNSSIAFSSNRLEDSLKTVTRVTQGNFNTELSNFNIFVYRPKQSKTSLQRITNTLGINTNPKFLDNKNLVYLSEATGIYQLKKYNLDDKKDVQITNYTQSIRTFDVSPKDNGFVYLSLNKRRLYPNYVQNFDFKTEITELSNTERSFLRKQRNRTTNVEEVVVPKKTIDTLVKKEELPVVSLYEKDEIDTDNYPFDENIIKKEQDNIEKKQTDLLEIAKKANQNTEIKIKGTFGYTPKARFENVLTTLLIDPIRNAGMQINMSTADLLENHKIKGGFVYYLDLRSSDFFGEYQYLAKRYDVGMRFDRKTIGISQNDPLISQRYTLNRIQTTFSYPITNLLRASVHPFYTNTTTTSLDNPFAFQNKAHYAGIRAELVYDKSIITGQNMLYGTRAKITFENYQGIAVNEGLSRQNVKPKDLNFFKLTADLRHYFRIHRDIIFAVRGTFGRFGGNSPKNFLLGGMDNWVFNQKDAGRAADPLQVAANLDNSDLLFVEFVTNMRGYNYNKMSGENVILGNFELRLPIFKYIFGNRIRSSFFNNLQLVGFYDIGTAWTGISPFEKQNSINTRIVGTNQSVFTALVNDFKNPWLQGYGAGLRTIIFGYYAKFDVGMPVEDFIVGPEPKYYLTIGYDF
ncbi:MAG: hypothetical protein EAZ85_02485 [Bacteroidetes bacterium]|nr:MAG: hypothetical protein EAZ85_02485 [Bacteroidota bacterium]TAG88304.1 MAG: hypothetical protein EAZ20_08840 [Bacteroidota bacterium]